MDKKTILLIGLLILGSGVVTYDLIDLFGSKTMSCTDAQIINETGIFLTHMGCEGGLSSDMEVGETITLLIERVGYGIINLLDLTSYKARDVSP